MARAVMLLSVCAALAAVSVRAWDSGPASCAKSACSGGVSKTVALKYTDLAYDLWSPIHRLATCPSGYKNDGFVCRLRSHAIEAPSHLAIAPDGFHNRMYHSGRGIATYAKKCSNALKRYACRDGYVDMGCFCLRGAALGALSCKKDYFCDKNRGRCYRRCPKGYVNTGELCVKPDCKNCVLGKEHMTCAQTELKYNTYCFPKVRKCPSGYHLWGSRCTRCYKTCPSGWFRSDVATCSYRLRWRGNTHLWIVKQALSLLKADEKGKKCYAYMMNTKCMYEWLSGMNAATEYESHATMMNSHAHYFNPTGKDYRGNPTSTKTYLDPVAKSPKNAYDAIGMYLAKKNCRALGHALHLLVDLTMPAHSSSFGPKSYPYGLLASLEAYAPSVQARYPAKGKWDRRWVGEEPKPIVVNVATRSNSRYAKPLFGALLKRGAVCKMNPPICYQPYVGFCFANDAMVNKYLGEALKDAYHSVASWIYSNCGAHDFKWEAEA